VLTAEVLRERPGLRHAFFTRQGGVSTAPFDSLNCGYGSNDDAAKVTENRARALQAAKLPAGSLVTAYQTHSTHVAIIEGAPAAGTWPKVDAFVAAKPGATIGILTADCAPVLFADAEAGVIGAAHAGWRGALDGVVGETVAAMTRLGARPQRIAAAIGPCIGRESYEVGPEFPAPFLAQRGDNARFFRPAERAGHFRFDLSGYVASRLAEAGVETIEILPFDTCADSDRFFSWRRTCHEGRKQYGRLLSAIALEG
jgi:YfiH family protein